MGQRMTLPIRFGVLICAMAMTSIVPLSGAMAATSRSNLQALVNDTAAQIQLAYRQHPGERDNRQQQLAAVLAAWRAAARSEANNQRLATWLHAAILSSMPGSNDPLPPAPVFLTKAGGARSAESVLVKTAPVEANGKTEADPFRDDPAGERE